MITKLIDKFVKVIYMDGEKVKALYGTLIGYDDVFISLRYKNGKIVMINKTNIIRISLVDETRFDNDDREK